MPRIRTLKPEFWADEKIGPLPPIDRLVFLGLVSLADDCGRVLDNVKQIDAALFPYTDDSARESLDRLSSLHRIARGETSSGQRVIQIKNWHHQKIEKPNLCGALPPIAGFEDADERTSYLKRKAVPKWMREAVFSRDKHTCQECGKENLRISKTDRYDAGPDLGEVDHRVEAIDGGRPEMENLVLLCLPCNRKKAGLERRRRNEERAAIDAKRLADLSLSNQRQISDDSATRRPPDLRPTTNDLRPVPTTRTSTNSAVRKHTAHKGEDGPKYPHFPMPLCLEMHALWVSRFGAVTVPVFRKEFGPLFTIAEADRPATAPTDAELRDALRSYVDLAPMGDGATFATVRRAAGVLAAIAAARREHADEPERRLDAVMRIIHGRQRVAA